MSVDAKLYVGAHVSPEMIASVVMRTMGEQVDNPFTGGRIVERALPSSPVFYVLSTYPNLYLYFNTDGPTGPCWTLSGSSRDDVIGILTAVGQAFGGFLVYQDIDDKGQLFHRPEAGHELFLALEQQMLEVGKINDFSPFQQFAAYAPSESVPAILD